MQITQTFPLYTLLVRKYVRNLPINKSYDHGTCYASEAANY